MILLIFIITYNQIFECSTEKKTIKGYKASTFECDRNDLILNHSSDVFRSSLNKRHSIRSEFWTFHTVPGKYERIYNSDFVSQTATYYNYVISLVEDTSFHIRIDIRPYRKFIFGGIRVDKCLFYVCFVFFSTYIELYL